MESFKLNEELLRHQHVPAYHSTSLTILSTFFPVKYDFEELFFAAILEIIVIVPVAVSQLKPKLHL